jgi:hypothetical protein
MFSISSPTAAMRFPSSFMLSPASTRMRVFSVARKAALPELPLANTQNLTMTRLLDPPEYNGSRRNKMEGKCFGPAGRLQPPETTPRLVCTDVREWLRLVAPSS